MKHGNRADIGFVALKSCNIWRNVNVRHFIYKIRVNEIQIMNFSNYLFQAGENQNVDFTEFIIQPNCLKSLIE